MFDVVLAYYNQPWVANKYDLKDTKNNIGY